MSSDLVPHDPTKLSFLPPQAERGSIWNLAQQIQGTEFVPSGLRGKPEAIMAAMLTGRELGILPMRALRQVQVIDGRPTPSPELMMALALKAGHFVRVVETTNKLCTVEVRRHDWPDKIEPSRLTWTLDDAVQAGLCTLKDGRPYARSQKGKPLPWESYTRAMLRSRAVSEACRAWLPDVVEGASYTPEELGGQVTEDGHGIDVVEMAEARGEAYDPLEGEPEEVREAVAEAMGDGDVAVDANGDEIVDAEVVPEDVPPPSEGGAPAREESSDGGGPTQKQRKRLFAVLRDVGINEAQRKAALRGIYKVDSLNDLTFEQVDKLIETVSTDDGAARFRAVADEWLADEQAQQATDDFELIAEEPASDSSDSGYDWQAHLKQAGGSKVDLIRTLVAAWPDNNQWNRPSRSNDITKLCADPKMAALVRDTIDKIGDGA